MRPLRSVRARVAPDHGFVIVLGTGFREPFQPDFRERRLCYAGDDMLYLMSAVGFAHDDDVTIEAWPGPPPPDPAAEQSETASMLLTEGRLYVSRALEAAASPVLAAGPGGRYELRVEVTGRAALAEYYARYTPGEPKAVESLRVCLWPGSTQPPDELHPASGADVDAETVVPARGRQVCRSSLGEREPGAFSTVTGGRRGESGATDGALTEWVLRRRGRSR